MSDFRTVAATFGSAQTRSRAPIYKKAIRSIQRAALDPQELPTMNIHLGLAPIISLLAGILILVLPRMLNYVVAIYLIVIGLIGLFGAGNMRLS